MTLKENLYYWNLSLKNPEPLLDESYFSDEIIINDENFLEDVRDLKKLLNSNKVKLGRINDILKKRKNIQYTDFVAFWKTVDFSFSIFKKLDATKKAFILKKLLKIYRKKRLLIYAGESNLKVAIQSLYDSGSSRENGEKGFRKIIKLIAKYFKSIKEAASINDFKNNRFCYFDPRAKWFSTFKKEFRIKHKFAKKTQNKRPDLVLKINSKIFIIEAKHIKEVGGSQNGGVNELIQFINFQEDNSKICFISFVDGIYFNDDLIDSKEKSPKYVKQRDSIRKNLEKSPSNFFVNTKGFASLLNDMKNS